MVAQTTHILETSASLPENRTDRSLELLASTLALVDDLLKQDRLPAAAVLGQKGGEQTAKRGSEYFLQLAAKRRNHGGGRPRKKS
jgi:hypothetical protein